MSTLYYGLSTFGGFVIGVAAIGCAAFFVVGAIYSRQLEKENEQRWREHYRKRGE